MTETSNTPETKTPADHRVALIEQVNHWTQRSTDPTLSYAQRRCAADMAAIYSAKLDAARTNQA